ncbi:MAG: TIR domain-containing protein [Acidobacteriota bacterium]|nr:TIR domain-containing protein [Acidobacteriota bacterium]
MPRRKLFDVFLSHDSRDKAAIEELAARLEDEFRLKPFVDKWHLVPGEPWQEGIERALDQSRTCAVFLGPMGIGPWENEEMRAALETRVKRPSFRVIPVLLPGAKPPDIKKLPPFLRRQGWVDFRSDKGLANPEAFNKLVAGIRGTIPGRISNKPRWLQILSLPELRNPTGLAVDGNVLYVADHRYGHVLRIINGQVKERYVGLDRPHHLSVLNGSLLITDSHHNRIVCTDSQLKELSSWRQFGRYSLLRPHAVEFSGSDGCYVLSSGNHCLLLIKRGKVKAVVKSRGQLPSGKPGEFSTPCGMCLGPHHVYIADTFNHRIQVFSHNLQYVGQFGSFGYGPGEFAYPVGIANWHNWLVVSDEHNQRLQLWQVPEGQADFAAKYVISNILSDWLGSPFGVTFDTYGTLYVADRKDGKLLIIDFQSLLKDYIPHCRAEDEHS